MAINSNPHFDRTVGMALVVTIALETASGIYRAGRMSTRIEQLEIKARLTHPIDLRLARLEEQVGSIEDSVLRIENDLNTVEENAYE